MEQTGLDNTNDEIYHLRRTDFLFSSKAHVMASATFCAIIFMMLLHKDNSLPYLIIWNFIFVSYITFRLIKCKRYQKLRAENRIRNPLKWENYYILTSLVGGLLWGLGSVFLVQPSTDPISVFMVTVLFCGVVTGSLPGNASSVKSTFVFITAVLLPLTIKTFFLDFTEKYSLALMIFFFNLVLFPMSKKICGLITNNIKLGLENENLGEEVKFSEKMRHDAEQQAMNSSKLAAIGEMASGIAHEINNPLAILKGNLGLIAKMVKNGPIDPEKFQKHFDKVNSGSDRIAQIIKGLKKVSRDGSLDEFIDITVAEVVDDTLTFTKEKLRSQGIELFVELDNPNSKIHCQQIQLSQVLINLITNSMHAIEGQSRPWIKVSTFNRDKFAIIEVSDRGSGIPKEVADKIFQPFFTTKDVGLGTGLGLSISKGIIDAHHGTITIDHARPNTCFVISIPLASEPLGDFLEDPTKSA